MCMFCKVHLQLKQHIQCDAKTAIGCRWIWFKILFAFLGQYPSDHLPFIRHAHPVPLWLQAKESSLAKVARVCLGNSVVVQRVSCD